MEQLSALVSHVYQGKSSEADAIETLKKIQEYYQCGYAKIAFVPIESALRRKELTQMLLKRVKQLVRKPSRHFRARVSLYVSNYMFKHYFEPQVRAKAVKDRGSKRVLILQPSMLKKFVDLAEVLPFTHERALQHSMRMDARELVDLYRGRLAYFAVSYEIKKCRFTLTISLGLYNRTARPNGQTILHPRREEDIH